MNSILDNSAKVVEAIKNQISEKPSSFEELKEAIKTIATEVTQSSTNIAHEIKDELTKVKNDEDIQKIVAAAKEKIDATTNGVEQRLNRVSEKLKEIFEYVNNKKNESLEDIKQAIKQKLNELSNVSSKIVEKVKHEIEKAKNIEEVQKVIALAQEYVDKALTTVKGGLKKVTDKLNEIHDSIKDQGLTNEMDKE